MPNKTSSYESIHTYHNYPIHIHIFKGPVPEKQHLEKHWHRSIEIAYRINCSGYLYLNNKKIELLPNEVRLINSCDEHAFDIEASDYRHTILVMLPYEFLHSIIPDIDQYRFRVDPDNSVMRTLMLDIESAYTEQEKYSYLKITSLAYKMLHYLMENCAQKRTARETLSLENRKWGNQVMAYIANNLASIHTVNDISDHFGYSREHFCRLFKKNMGISCHAYLTEKRLEIARTELEKGTDSLDILAESLGFHNTRTFCDVFLRAFGMTPLQYTHTFLHFPDSAQGFLENQELQKRV